MSPFRTLLGAARVLIVRPSLWPTAAVQARRFAPDGWWRRAPFLAVVVAAALTTAGLRAV